MECNERLLWAARYEKWCDIPVTAEGNENILLRSPNLFHAIIWMTSTEEGKELVRKLAKEIK